MSSIPFSSSPGHDQHMFVPHQLEQQQLESGPRAKCDQVIFEAIAKAAEIIVHGRSTGGGGEHGTLQQQQQRQQMSHSSSRFNLIVPEVPGVREILNRWRRALHVPLRLDLYYQNPDNPNHRQLLERWCIEYIPSSRQDLFLERECRTSSDPIVQLRHVCKKIVIWLRNLYCSARLLPAQALQHSSCQQPSHGSPPLVAFSIYVLATAHQGTMAALQNDGMNANDLAELTQHHGFLSHSPIPSVVTPYGELVWRVFHAPKSVIEPFLPPHHPAKSPLWMPRAPSMARPIQVAPSTARLGQEPSPQRDQGGAVFPQSAPAAGVRFAEHYHQAKQPTQAQQSFDRMLQGPGQHQNNNLQLHQHRQQQQQQQQQQPSHSYQPSSRQHMLRSQSAKINGPLAQEDMTNHNLTNNGGGIVLQRRNTAIGIEDEHVRQSVGVTEQGLERPERVLSGLSLALMADAINSSTTTDEDKLAEKRRAALHHAPPHHWMEQQHHRMVHNPDPTTASPAAGTWKPNSTGEYGYAYNNHIAWQQIRPSATVPTNVHDAASVTTNDRQQQEPSSSNSHYVLSQSPGGTTTRGRLGSSPSLLAGTPPSGAFFRLGVTPPTTASFLPPRTPVTPPFPSRPVGFADLPPLQSETPQQHPPLQHQGSAQRHAHEVVPPITSLDLLRSSPFQQGASVLSSLSVAGGGPGGMVGAALYGPAVSHMASHQGSSVLRPAFWNSISGPSSVLPPSSREEDHDDDDLGLECEMPFAVDDEASTTTNASAQDNPLAMVGGGKSNSESISLLASSAAVTSFAQKCAPSQHRLKLFESVDGAMKEQPHRSQQPGMNFDLTASSFDDQLSEFRDFGASLMLTQDRRTGSGHDESSGSSSTPITLKT